MVNGNLGRGPGIQRGLICMAYTQRNAVDTLAVDEGRKYAASPLAQQRRQSSDARCNKTRNTCCAFPRGKPLRSTNVLLNRTSKEAAPPKLAKQTASDAEAVPTRRSAYLPACAGGAVSKENPST